MQPRNAKKIWLLGASTGGLQAVRQFLSNVPVTSDLAFVYAQHIAGQQINTVLRMIETQTGWPARELSTGQFIRPGTVTVISPQYETTSLYFTIFGLWQDLPSQYWVPLFPNATSLN